MKMIQGQIITSKSIAIDDTKFVDCTLIDCILEYSGYPVVFERTRMRAADMSSLAQPKAQFNFFRARV